MSISIVYLLFISSPANDDPNFDASVSISPSLSCSPYAPPGGGRWSSKGCARGEGRFGSLDGCGILHLWVKQSSCGPLRLHAIFTRIVDAV